MKVYNFSGKDKDTCRIKCLEDLDLYYNEIITTEYEDDNLYKMDVLKKSEIKDYILSFLTKIFDKMNITAKIDIDEIDEIFTVKISSKDNAIIIGKEGKNLSSLQFLLKQSLRVKTKFNLKINIDVSNYRLRRQQLFEDDVKKIINDVLTTKTDTNLDPMNSYQRRIVHNVANNYYNIETVSVGEEPNRCVVIKYIEN